MQTTRLNKVNKILQDFSPSLLLEGIYILKRKVWYIVLLRLPGPEILFSTVLFLG